MIQLTHPALLLLGSLLLIPVLLRPRRAWLYSSLLLLQGGPRSHPVARLTTWVTGVAVCLLLTALARPQGGHVHTQQVREVRDIVLTLDLSLSMEDDIASIRGNGKERKIDLMQQAALGFVHKHQHDRVGLLVFGDDAFGVWPLSTDHTALQQRLQHLDTLLPSDLRGTDVTKALLRSLDHFQVLGQSDTQLLLLFTDGLDTFDPEVEAHIVQRLRHQQVTLYVLGLNLNNESPLIQLLHQSQGRYFNVGKSEDLNQALQAIDRLETSQIIVRHETAYQDWYAFFALPGLLLFVVSTVCKSIWVVEV
jgi:Ca-activated chloride channel family protein